MVRFTAVAASDMAAAGRFTAVVALAAAADLSGAAVAAVSACPVELAVPGVAAPFAAAAD